MSGGRLSERAERSPVVRSLLSLAIAALLLAEVATHLPEGSAVSQLVSQEANHLIRFTATEQQWGVFAPDPRQTSLGIEGRVTFEDGSTAVWELPDGPRIGANLRFYRWRKWLERLRSDDYEGLWDPTARWIASLYDDRASPVAKVELVRRFRPNRIAGEQPPYDEFTYHTYVVERSS